MEKLHSERAVSPPTVAGDSRPASRQPPPSNLHIPHKLIAEQNARRTAHGLLTGGHTTQRRPNTQPPHGTSSARPSALELPSLSPKAMAGGWGAVGGTPGSPSFARGSLRPVTAPAGDTPLASSPSGRGYAAAAAFPPSPNSGVMGPSDPSNLPQAGSMRRGGGGLQPTPLSSAWLKPSDIPLGDPSSDLTYEQVVQLHAYLFPLQILAS